MVNIDFRKIGYTVNKILMNRTGKPSFRKGIKYKLHYKESNLQVLNMAEVTLFTLQACKYKKAIKIKIKEKQIGIKEIEYTQIRAILRVQRNSICEVTEKYIGGSDEYHNLMFLNSSFKNLLKSENKKDYYIDDDNYQKILKILSKYK